MIKNILLLAVFTMILGSCNTNKNSKSVDNNTKIEKEERLREEPIAYVEARGYFVLNTVKNEKVESLRITSQDHFDKFFGVARTMGKEGEPTVIDFKKSFVLALVGQPTDKETSFKIEKLTSVGDNLELVYEIEQLEEERSFTIHPCVILVIDKKYEKDVRFLLQ